MANIYGNGGAIDFRTISAADLNGAVGVSSNTSATLVNGSSQTTYTFSGQFASSSTAGMPTNGTISQFSIGKAGLTTTFGSMNVQADTTSSLAANGNSLGFYQYLVAGADVITGSDVGDWVDGGAGADNIFGNGGADTLFGGAGDNILVGGLGDDLIASGAGNSKLFGNEGNDTLAAGTGLNTLSGGDGDDVIFASDTGNLGVGGNGNDTIVTGSGSDAIYGDAGNDVLWGGGGGDFMFGGEGNDIIIGQTGDDYMSGGGGADRFYIFGGDGKDWISDFSSAQGDRVILTSGTAYSISYGSGGAVISLSSGGTITLEGVTSSSALGDWLIYS